MKIDPRRLLELLAVAKYRSISGAAEATNVSQPGLSQSIALLERELGVKVLERGRHGARLNEFGDALAFHAEALEALLHRAEDEMRMRSLGLAGSLAIGITPVTAVGLVPHALDMLLQETPGVLVSVTEGLDKEIMHMLRTRQLDLLVSRLGVGPAFSDVEEERLFAADWALITSPRHPLAGHASVKLSELQDVQWALPAGGSAFREQMERVFAVVGQRWPQHGIVTNSILAIKSAVMTTDCVTVMSPSLVEIEVAMGRLRAIPLEDVEPLQPVGLIWRRDDKMSAIAARFAKILRAIAVEA
jgi:DNA-binding transcriptional LysR family regulator